MMIKSIELKFTSGNDVPVERAVITRDEFMQIKQQAETIERLKSMNAALLEGIKTVKTAYNNYMTASQSDAVFAHIEMQEAFKTLNKLEAGEL